MRRSELSPEFGSFGIKHPENHGKDKSEVKENSIGENVVEAADVKADEDAEVETDNK